MSADHALSRTYAEARGAFMQAAATAGAAVHGAPHPRVGPSGEHLSVDVATVGAQDAADVVVVVSATHGVEGFCGSALQARWLTEAASGLGDGIRVALVHALNPYGFAWVRRVNEDNVDLNRNFIDWVQPAPANDDYDAIAALLVPGGWSAEEQQRTTASILQQAAQWGFPRLQAAVSGGQYRHPTGVFYGGSGPVWSHRWLREWSSTALAGAGRVTIIDLHTGLGPWGVGELICSARHGQPAYERAAALWGAVTSMLDGDSVSSPLAGDWLAIADALAPGAVVTAAALEFGTVDTVTVLQALRADAWLHAFGDPTGPAAAAVRAQVRAAFADDDPAWLAACWSRFVEVMGAAIAACGGVRR